MNKRTVCVGAAAALLLVCAAAAPAQRRKIEDFVRSVQRRVPFKADRVLDVADHVWFGVNRPWTPGVASYNEVLDCISVERRLADSENHRIKPLDQLFGELGGSDGTYYQVVSGVGTVFHELAHAEWYHFFGDPRDGDADDEALRRTLQLVVRPALERGLPHLNANRVMQELHGYFVNTLWETMFTDAGEILSKNGISPVSMKVVDFQVARNLRMGFVAPAELGRLSASAQRSAPTPGQRPVDVPGSPLSGVFAKRYAERCSSFTFVVGGTSVTTAQLEAMGLAPLWHEAMWAHLEKHHDLPESAAELCERLNQGHPEALASLAAAQARVLEELAGTEQQMALLGQSTSR